MNKLLVSLSFILISSFVSAQSVVIDFEAAAGAAPVNEDGFTLTADGPNAVFTPGVAVDNGTNIFGWCANDCGALQNINLSEDTAEVFTLVSIDSANLTTGSFQAGQTIDLVGNLSGGGTVAQSFVIVPETYTTFVLDPSFTNLTSVDISSNPTSCPTGICDIGIDNISLVLGVVAAPAVSVPTLSNLALIAMMLIFSLLATRYFTRAKV